MKKIIRGKAAKLSRRTFIVGSAAAAAGSRSDSSVPFGTGPALAQADAAAEVNVWVAIKPDDTCVIRIVRSEMGQGTHHRPRPARRRGARMRLEQGHASSRSAPGTRPGPQAHLGRHVDRRQPRHPQLAGLCPPRRRRRAHDAAAGRGRRMEGAGRRARRGERRHHATPPPTARPATARSPRPPPSSSRRILRASSSGIRRTGRSRASRSSGSTPPTSSTAARSTPSTSSCPACCAPRSRIVRCSAAR